MDLAEPIPFERDAQLAIAGRWGTLVGGRQHGTALSRAHGVRGLVRDSWFRSFDALVRPDLPAAPVVLDENQVHVATGQADWFETALRAVRQHRQSFGGVGHILTLFDRQARMLSCEGDPAAVEGLAEINFRPGGLWAEEVVGTNGPGTALATGQPAHIVGAEHFCERWHRWHCAAVPIRDPATREVAGVLDISGFREQAHPHTLNLVLALVFAIEQALSAREVERRYLTLRSFTELSARHPGDLIIALGRTGEVLSSTATLPAGCGESLLAAVQDGWAGLSREPGVVGLQGEHAATWLPVLDGPTVVGGCLLFQGSAPQLRTSARLTPEEVPTVAKRLFDAAARDLGLLEVIVEPQVYEAFQAYDWPGGLRELKQLARRLLVHGGRTIRLADLPLGIREAHPGSTTEGRSAIDAEDALLMQVVRDSRTMAEAAHRLGITRSTLYRRIERFGLKQKRILWHD